MKHPAPETWMEYLYGETPADLRQALDLHAAQCSECRSQLEAWQKARQELSRWENPVAQRPAASTSWRRRAALVAAGAVLLSVGFLLGRQGTPAADWQAWRGQIESEIRRSVQKELAAWRNSGYQEILDALQQQEERVALQLAQLRRDLETVAVLAEARLQSAQNRINQLVLAQHSGDEK